MKRLFWLCASLCLLYLPAGAQAFDGFVVANVNLRAGPDVGYPAITVLPAGATVSIEGCIDGWTWCDVIVGPDRGWVAGTYLEDNYEGNRVIVTDYGPRIGIPIVAFALGAYWDRYYHGRPWYHDRDRWEHRTFSFRAPPRPHGFDHGFDHGNTHGSDRGHNYPHGSDHGHAYDASHGDAHGTVHGVEHRGAPAHGVEHRGEPAHVAAQHAPVVHHAAPAAHRADTHGHDHDHDHDHDHH